MINIYSELRKKINISDHKIRSFFLNTYRKFKDEKIPEPENSLEIILAHVLEKTTLKAVRGEKILKEINLTDEQITKIDEYGKYLILIG